MRVTRSKATTETLYAMLNNVDDPHRLAIVFAELSTLFDGKKSMDRVKFYNWLNAALD